MNTVNFTLGLENVEKHLQQSRNYCVGDLLIKNARRNPSATAIISEDEEELTYQELNTRVNCLANGLLASGVDYGDCIAVVSENRPEYVELIYACAKIGTICAAMNWRQAEREIRHCLDLVDADVVVLSRKQVDNHPWMTDEDEGPATTITVDAPTTGISYDSLIEQGSSRPPQPSTTPTPEDGLLIVYTSGTTGLPKGAILSHRSLLIRAMTWKELTLMGPSYTCWKPMFHMMGTEPIVVTGMDGGILYIINGFQPNLILNRYTRSRQGYLPLSLGSVDRLIDTYEAENYAPNDFEGAETVGSMADLYPRDKIKRITEAFDAQFMNTYGATEIGVGPLSGNKIPTGVAPDDDDIYKTEGPMVDLKLVDNDWNEVPQGNYGELAVRGPAVFSGYIGNAEANRESFDNGWFRTGDIFEQLENGQYDYIDRKKYLIKSGGENIYPAAIEKPLIEHDEIKDACVAGKPDERWGEVPKAYIATTTEFDMNKMELLDYLRLKIANYKLPHYVEFVDKEEFPRSTTGKIVRTEIEDWPVTERVRNP